MSRPLYNMELEFLAKVREWVENEPGSDLYYISHVVIHDTDGEVVGRFYTGDDARFEFEEEV